MIGLSRCCFRNDAVAGNAAGLDRQLHVRAVREVRQQARMVNSSSSLPVDGQFACLRMTVDGMTLQTSPRGRRLFEKPARARRIDELPKQLGLRIGFRLLDQNTDSCVEPRFQQRISVAGWPVPDRMVCVAQVPAATECRFDR